MQLSLRLWGSDIQEQGELQPQVFDVSYRARVVREYKSPNTWILIDSLQLGPWTWMTAPSVSGSWGQMDVPALPAPSLWRGLVALWSNTPRPPISPISPISSSFFVNHTSPTLTSASLSLHSLLQTACVNLSTYSIAITFVYPQCRFVFLPRPVTSQILR